MRIEQLKLLATVSRLGSFRRAADVEHLSQAALSETIRNLESELGVQLLHRNSRGAKLNDVGDAVLPLVHEMVELDRHLRDQIDHYKSVLQGVIRFGTVNVANSDLVPQVLPSFLSDHPGINLMATQAGSLEILGQVRDRELDLGLIVHDRSMLAMLRNDSDIHVTELQHGSVHVYLPVNHRLASRPRINLMDIANESLIVFREGYMMNKFVTELFNGLPIRVVFNTNDTQSAKSMVAARLGITLLPVFGEEKTLASISKLIAIVPLAKPHNGLSLSMIRRRQKYVSGAIEALSMAFIEHSRQ